MESILKFSLRMLIPLWIFPTVVDSFVVSSTVLTKDITCLQSQGGNRRRFPRLAASTTTQDEVESDCDEWDISEKRIISIDHSLELPFAAEIAYDAYSDLTRQPSWSSWLHLVQYTDTSHLESLWTLKFLGFKYSWSAISLKNERPRLIQWKSTSGLENFGTVVFEPVDETNTIMTLTMTLAAPRAVAALFRKSKRLQEFIKEKMIVTSLDSFRQVVLQEEVVKSDETDI